MPKNWANIAFHVQSPIFHHFRHLTYIKYIHRSHSFNVLVYSARLFSEKFFNCFYMLFIYILCETKEAIVYFTCFVRNQITCEILLKETVSFYLFTTISEPYPFIDVKRLRVRWWINWWHLDLHERNWLCFNRQLCYAGLKRHNSCLYGSCSFPFLVCEMEFWIKELLMSVFISTFR